MDWLIKAGWNAENVTNYDCRGMVRQRGNGSVILGMWSLIYGITAEADLKKLRDFVTDIQTDRQTDGRRSIYRINDMCAISLNSIVSGYFWLIGANYCMYPTLIYVMGAIALGLWCCACMNCLVLVINRLLDLWTKRVMQMLFKGNRTYVVLVIPLLYFLYFTFFTPPVLFNSDRMAWFFATFADGHDPEKFLNYPHTANNLLIVVLTCLLYVQYSRVLFRHSRASTGLTWAQKSFFLQTSSICMSNLIAALIYVYMNFFATPSYFVVIGHICWQLGHGFPAFVYLFLNRTIQREALALLKFSRKTNSLRPLGVTTSTKALNHNET
ncbi:hypothetical protein V3C99_011339 [Haemonchus contortus]|uniref:G protein-coupled receptor n=1 Tax=Haemonchus contortus TaxID=6289 RepID=A0A7I4Y8B0_HAECO